MQESYRIITAAASIGLPTVARVGDVFKALAAPTRRIILDELAGRNGQTLSDICARLIPNHGLGTSRQAISQPLAALQSFAPVPTRRRGRHNVQYTNTR